ncbi:heavy metal sensor histidine kinase [Allopusillimonas soli]|uniref:Sensor protein n=1 Tax=Allopusillimonas soli TaxID=659016 RepID=A0A853F9S3_9BURK|nr:MULTISPECIES: Cu(+)/Ag(+) sensor histidine kinase [Alcaligenaceae]MCC2597817.1 Cu(+)/Ag(+) sensor histidine kinase [Pusillimonas sp. MFBS29]NYT36362.1 Cu(+)/Ag(+) sensor histidine kinase [Allopusillimonas soli]TEA76679.1 heavy metal sensor histidine kinase [Allopusillimonas soli]
MKRRPASLAVRLTVSIGAVITVVLLTFGWIVERSINNHFIQQDVDELNAVVQALKHTLATLPPDIASAELNQRFANAVSGHHNAQYRISSDSGALIYATPGSNLDRFARIAQPVEKITIDTVGIWQDHGETFRGAVLRSGSDSFPAPRTLTIAVATGINFHLHYLDSFRDYLRIITVAACLIAILATWLAVHQGHAPIRRISREIRKIRSDQLHIRLEPQAVPTELVELAMSFNGMLERLEDVFRRLSDFSGDIAHELRTPITNLKTQTEVALSQSRSVEQYREILYSNLEEYERMAKMVSDMLFLAKADNNLLKPELVEIDLQAEMRILFDYFGAWAEEREVGLKLVGPRGCIIGDRLMIRRALSNLLSNAIRYTPAGGTVTAIFEVESTNIRLCVQNPGPVIPPEHITHIFERFYRPDASRQRTGEGAGLGLAIVKSIVEAHGGKISARSTAEATTFEILSPATKC